MPAFRIDPRARVVAIAAASPEKARSVAAALDIPHAHASWRDLVADPAVSIVSIAVPAELQCEIAAAAAAQGKHLFLEKPVGTSLDEVRGLAAAIQARRVAATVDFLFARVAAFEDARRAVAAGELGAIGRVRVTWRTRTYAHRMGLDSWKLRSASGGGALHAFASHVFHYLESLAGPVRSMSARMTPDDARDARVDAECELASGGMASIEIDTDFSGEPEHVVELTGALGSLVLENRARDTVAGFARGGTPTHPPGGTADDRIAPVSRIVTELIDAIGAGATASPRLQEGVRVQQLIDAARRSHERGGRVAT